MDRLEVVFLRGKSHGQRSWRATIHGVTKEVDMTEQLHITMEEIHGIISDLFGILSSTVSTH